MNDTTTAVASPAAAPPPHQPATPANPPAQSTGFKTTIADGAYEQLPPDQQARYSRTRGNGFNGSQWVERTELEPPGDQAAVKPGEAPSVTADGKLKVGDYELSSDDIATLLQHKAAAELRTTQIPADASGYEPKLPEGLKLPDGVEFRIDSADPALQDFRALAKKIGLSQSEFSEFIGVYAAKTAASEAAFRTSMAAELAKLGDHATMRVSALQTFFRGHVGDDLAKAVTGGLFSAKQVEAMEIIARKMGSQGAASFRQDGREPASNARGPLSSMSEAEYNALSAGERYSIAKRG